MGLDDILTESDREALDILKEVLETAKTYFQSFKREKLQKDIEKEYNEEFKKKRDRTK